MSERHIDPVCGMEVTEQDAACSYEYQGRTYYFCAEACRDQFTQNPEAHPARRD
ncbi:MAG: YHS domain-containing protein [bacterium]